jgi:hypothetical protein
VFATGVDGLQENMDSVLKVRDEIFAGVVVRESLIELNEAPVRQFEGGDGHVNGLLQKIRRKKNDKHQTLKMRKISTVNKSRK